MASGCASVTRSAKRRAFCAPPSKPPYVVLFGAPGMAEVGTPSMSNCISLKQTMSALMRPTTSAAAPACRSSRSRIFLVENSLMLNCATLTCCGPTCPPLPPLPVGLPPVAPLPPLPSESAPSSSAGDDSEQPATSNPRDKAIDKRACLADLGGASTPKGRRPQDHICLPRTRACRLPVRLLGDRDGTTGDRS